MKNSIKTLAVWLIIGIILIVAVTTILDNSNTKFAYSELIEAINAGQVESIELSADGYSANVKLKNDNTTKNVNIPSVDNLMDNLQEEMQAGTIEVSEESESVWAIFLTFLTPIGIVIIFFIFLFFIMLL